MNNVLLVDDETFILDILQTTIPWEKYDLTVSACATDGLTALELFQANPFDLVITDMKMPRMSGLELIQELHKLSPTTPFLVMSSYDDFHLVRSCFKYGALDYILKIDIDDLETIDPVFKHIQNLLKERLCTPPALSLSAFYETNITLTETVDEQCLSNHTPFLTIKSQLIEHIKTLNIQECISLFDALLEEMKKIYTSPEVFLQEAYIVLNYAHTILLSYGFDATLLPALPPHMQEVLDTYPTYTKLSSWLKAYFSQGVTNISHTNECNLNSLVTGYIKENYANASLSIQAVAAATGVDKKQLSKICVQATGLHFKAFLNEVRISQAKNLIAHTTFKINEISYMVGYSNIEHFSRVFSQQVGMSPSMFQQQQTKKEQLYA